MILCFRLGRVASIFSRFHSFLSRSSSTDFEGTIFLAEEKNFEDQKIALFRIRMQSTIRLERSFFLRPKCSSKPSYFPTPPFFVINSSFLTLILISSGVLVKKVIADICQFILCPEAVSYFLRILNSIWQLCVFALQKDIVSSANRRWLILGLLLGTLGLVSFHFPEPFYISLTEPHYIEWR